jgi:hypothetical protein
MKAYVECNALKPSAKPTATCDGNRCIVYSPVPGKIIMRRKFDLSVYLRRRSVAVFGA